MHLSWFPGLCEHKLERLHELCERGWQMLDMSRFDHVVNGPGKAIVQQPIIKAILSLQQQ